GGVREDADGGVIPGLGEVHRDLRDQILRGALAVEVHRVHREPARELVAPEHVPIHRCACDCARGNHAQTEQDDRCSPRTRVLCQSDSLLAPPMALFRIWGCRFRSVTGVFPPPFFRGNPHLPTLLGTVAGVPLSPAPGWTRSVRVAERPFGSAFSGKLSRGCRQCGEGAKLVLFVTGLCGYHCVYCPVSDEKMYQDVVFADEKRVTSDADVLEEARAIRAMGAGITGGDPLDALDRTWHYIRLLKRGLRPA